MSELLPLFHSFSRQRLLWLHNSTRCRYVSQRHQRSKSVSVQFEGKPQSFMGLHAPISSDCSTYGRWSCPCRLWGREQRPGGLDNCLSGPSQLWLTCKPHLLARVRRRIHPQPERITKSKTEGHYTDVLNFDLSSDLQRTQLFKEGRLFGLESKLRPPYLQFLNGGLKIKQKIRIRIGFTGHLWSHSRSLTPPKQTHWKPYLQKLSPKKAKSMNENLQKYNSKTPPSPWA